MFALFVQDNKQANVLKKRRWYNAGFQVLTRQLHSIIVEEVGELVGCRFLSFIKEYIGQCLQASPQYNYNKLSIIYKASKYYSQEA